MLSRLNAPSSEFRRRATGQRPRATLKGVRGASRTSRRRTSKPNIRRNLWLPDGESQLLSKVNYRPSRRLTRSTKSSVGLVRLTASSFPVLSLRYFRNSSLSRQFESSAVATSINRCLNSSTVRWSATNNKYTRYLIWLIYITLSKQGFSSPKKSFFHYSIVLKNKR